MPKTKDGGFRIIDGEDPYKLKKLLKPSKKTKRDDDPCWDSHEQAGTKTKNGKQVPNCIPKKRKRNG
tara:strand:- start:1342 stop:1542 length:201 start_codon:yes stop_codon:yes gene_type:complete